MSRMEVSLFITNQLDFNRDAVHFKIQRREVGDFGDIISRCYLSNSGEWVPVKPGDRIPDECIMEYEGKTP